MELKCAKRYIEIAKDPLITNSMLSYPGYTITVLAIFFNNRGILHR